MSHKKLKIFFDGVVYDPVDLKSRESHIGYGGNGDVYSLKRNNLETDYVVKVLRFFHDSETKKKKFQRLKNEIKTVTKFGDEELLENSILPIVYPKNEDVESLTKNKAYYVMPRAKAYDKRHQNFDLLKIWEMLSQILKALKFLHKNNLAHRDIKIDNILNYKGRWVLADFGLAISDEGLCGIRLTGDEERVGPRGLPDELCHPIDTCDIEAFKKSDIYLYGKLCWQLLTHNDYSFDGTLTQGSWAMMELKETSFKYECPILPLLEMMRKTICQFPDDREDLGFIEGCLAKQHHLIENQNNDEYARCREKQRMFFNFYSMKIDGYFKDNVDDLMLSLENLRNIEVSMVRNDDSRNIIVNFSKVFLGVESNSFALSLQDPINGNDLFYLKPRRIETRDGCVHVVLLDDFSLAERINLQYQDVKFDESKLLTSNDYVKIDCFSY